MEDFNIPKKISKVIELADTPSFDRELLKAFPSDFGNYVNGKFNSFNESTKSKITEMTDKLNQDNQKLKQICSKESIETYNQLKVIDQAITNKQLFTFEIEGRYDSSRDKPSLEYWINCNPGKKIAIDYLINKLASNGWNPSLAISDYNYDRDDHFYWGGDKLILTCDFRDN